MGIYVFGYDTALSAFRRAGARVAACSRGFVTLENAQGNLRRLRGEAVTRWLCEGQGAAHLIVSQGSPHGHSAITETHAWGSTGEVWPVVCLAEDLYLVAPEWLFLQMANVLGRVELALLGCELCGGYGFALGRLVDRPRLTSVASIGAFLDAHPGSRGCAKAREALAWVFDGARSPMEASLALRLAIPRRSGGFGIPAPELNHELALGPRAARVLGHTTITPDLLWEDVRLAVEYDSDAEHVGADRIARDSRRRLALETEGYRVITVTNEQFSDPIAFEGVADAIALACGKRLVAVSEETRRRSRALAWRLKQLAADERLLTCVGARRSERAAA